MKIQIPGNAIVFVAETKGPVQNDTGSLALHADASFDDVPAADILIVPGGPGYAAVCQKTRAHLIGYRPFTKQPPGRHPFAPAR